MAEKLEERDDVETKGGRKESTPYTPPKKINFSHQEEDDKNDADLLLKQLQKEEIKKQYPYRTDEDVDARYEIEHMEHRSADIMEDLHSGTFPSEALKKYRKKQESINNGTLIEHKDSDPELGLDGYTCTEQYDEYGRIILRRMKFDTEENGENTQTYTYNPDGSYTVVSIENGYKYIDQYDTHGKRISQTFNDEAPVDYSKVKVEGDYIGF